VDRRTITPRVKVEAVAVAAVAAEDEEEVEQAAEVAEVAAVVGEAFRPTQSDRQPASVCA
jgi:hypothetical protein